MQRRLQMSVAMLFVMLFFMVVLPQTGQAAVQPTLYLNGSQLKLPEAMTTINNSVMIPIRVVSEELGYKVDWNQKTRTVMINDSSTSITLVVDQNTATVNGEEKNLLTPVTVINQTTFVPLRFVGESMRLVVDWDDQSNSVYLYSSNDGSTTTPSVPGTGGNDSSTGNPDGSSTGNPDDSSTDKPDDSSTGNPDDTGTEGTVGEPITPPNTAIVKVTDFAFFDNTLHIAYNGQVKPTITTLNNPERIVIDFPQSDFSDEFKSKFVFDDNGHGNLKIADYPDVQGIRYAKWETDTVRFVIDANYALNYESISTSEGLLSLTLSMKTDTTIPDSETTTPKPKDQFTIVIDAGHGGKDSGAVSVNNRYEKTLNLGIANKVAELAKNEPKLNIVLTRSTDVFLELSERVSIANNLNADLFVSIHGNSIDGKPSVGGTETYYYRSDSKAFAEVMHKYLMKGTELKDRGVKIASHHVTRNTKMPAILLEIGFLSNSTEENKMYTEAFQYQVAQQIVNGLKAYLGLS